MVNCSKFFFLMTIYASYAILLAQSEDQSRRLERSLNRRGDLVDRRERFSDDHRVGDKLRLSSSLESDTSVNQRLREDRLRVDELSRDVDRRLESESVNRRVEENRIRDERLDRYERTEEEDNRRDRSDRRVEDRSERSNDRVELRREENRRTVDDRVREISPEQRREVQVRDVVRTTDRIQDRIDSRREEERIRSDRTIDRQNKREEVNPMDERRRSNDGEDQVERRSIEIETSRLIRRSRDNRSEDKQSDEKTINPPSESQQLTNILGQLVGLIVSIVLINSPTKGGYVSKVKQLFTINKVTI